MGRNDLLRAWTHERRNVIEAASARLLKPAQMPDDNLAVPIRK
jgi:hypothetical protein